MYLEEQWSLVIQVVKVKHLSNRQLFRRPGRTLPKNIRVFGTPPTAPCPLPQGSPQFPLWYPLGSTTEYILFYRQDWNAAARIHWLERTLLHYSNQNEVSEWHQYPVELGNPSKNVWWVDRRTTGPLASRRLNPLLVLVNDIMLYVLNAIIQWIFPTFYFVWCICGWEWYGAIERLKAWTDTGVTRRLCCCCGSILPSNVAC